MSTSKFRYKAYLPLNIECYFFRKLRMYGNKTCIRLTDDNSFFHLYYIQVNGSTFLRKFLINMPVSKVPACQLFCILNYPLQILLQRILFGNTVATTEMRDHIKRTGMRNHKIYLKITFFQILNTIFILIFRRNFLIPVTNI